jgi:16S rRNA (cytidine1402-2'-O)-methyltransferase
VGKLFVVSTPIGNLEDLTRRAERVLAEVPHVLAEDTRRTGTLLRHLGVRPEMMSLHAHNEASRRGKVLAWLTSGEDVALVSDAGTPLVSDPGARIVQAALEAGHEVVPIPGASAVLAALVASGLPADRFTFLGFLPRRGVERGRLLERLCAAEETTVLFESPERLVDLLDDLEAACGPERRVAVGRELTKVHETVVRGTLAEARRYYGDSVPRGEVTVVIEAAPPREAPDAADREAAGALALALLAEGASASGVAREVAKRLGLPRNVAYQVVQEAKGRRDDAT